MIQTPYCNSMGIFGKFFQKDTFDSFVKNKRVALVGPANYLNHFNFGEIIDSYDFTARINRGMELVKNHSLNIGSKTDILFNCLIEHNDNGGKIDIEKLNKSEVKWICTIPRSDFHGKVKSKRLSKGVKLTTILKLKYSCNFHIYDYKKYGYLNKKVKCRSNTGFSAIFDLLDSGVKEVYVTGYSFYMDSFMKGYKAGCSRDEEKFAEDCFSSIRHDQKNQWEYLKTFKDDPRLSFDPILGELLNKKSLKRSDFPEILDNAKNLFNSK